MNSVACSVFFLMATNSVSFGGSDPFNYNPTGNSTNYAGPSFFYNGFLCDGSGASA